MALIKCPECKKKVSDQCSMCPHCGYPISEMIKQEATKIDKNEEVVQEEKIVKERKPINKKILIGIISGAVIALTISGILGYNALLPKINATKHFNNAVASVKEKNEKLEKSIKSSEDLIMQKQPLLNEELRSALENTISDVKAVKETDFDIPDSVDEINARILELNSVDYTTALKNLSEKHNALVINAQRYQLVNQPTEAYVIQCLRNISEIVNISAVTEENDPNGQLNKLGGYTATVYFADSRINLDKSIYGETLIEQGTDAGGCIEVYTCVEDAVKRLEYLATFDGGVLSSGTHTVIGTVLIRVSNELTATQQKELETKIIAVLTYLPEYDKDILEEFESDSNQATVDKEETTTEEITTESNTEETTTNNKTPEIVQPVDRKQEAVAEAEKQANLWFPSDRHFIEYILVNPSLAEGFEAFTESEAAYAIEHANIDWKEHALYNAFEILDLNPGINLSQQDIYSFVEDSGGKCTCAGYTEEELQYAVYNCGINWQDRAISDMKLYWDNDYSVIVTLYDFYNYLAELGYDDTTIEYALNNTSGYYRGEAVESEQERVKLLLSYGYSREAIIDWYCQTMDYSEAETLVDSCIDE